MTRPSDLVRHAFASRIPLPEEIVRIYEEGFCDMTPAYGEWLREGQQRLDNGSIDGVLVCFSTYPGIYPRALASNLIFALTTSEDTYWSVDFILDSAWYFTEKWEDTQVGQVGNEQAESTLKELTPLESVITLMALARLSTTVLQDYLDDHHSAEILQWSEKLVKIASEQPEFEDRAKRFLRILSARTWVCGE